MRVAIVSDVIYEYISGLAVFTKRIIDELKPRVEKVIVITAGRKRKIIERDNVTIYYLKGISLKKFKEMSIGIYPLTCLKKIFREEKVDIVHCQSLLPMGAASVLQAKKMGIPAIFSSHIQLENVTKNLNIKSFHLKRLISMYGLWIYNNCDHIIFPSAYAQEELISYGIKITRKQMSVISNGVNINQFRPANHSKQLILFVGRVMPEKCIDTFIRASAIVRRTYPQYKFVIAGSGHILDDLKKLSEEINPDVVFTGKVSEEKLIELFQTCEMYVLPSESELQGITLLEAMACEKPTIASDSKSSAARELANIVFKHNDHKELAERIIFLIENKDIARKYAKRNREIVEKEHDYANVTNKFLSLYETLITRNNNNNNKKPVTA
ncbi:MAG: glycosyltransferase family 4 protein [Spirochaetales bacterium]|nr:glycosyltransferase family 4 protein [Spirochaetales bacterium]